MGLPLRNKIKAPSDGLNAKKIKQISLDNTQTTHARKLKKGNERILRLKYSNIMLH